MQDARDEEQQIRYKLKLPRLAQPDCVHESDDPPADWIFHDLALVYVPAGVANTLVVMPQFSLQWDSDSPKVHRLWSSSGVIFLCLPYDRERNDSPTDD